ncbi:MAG: 3'-5' exonuclease [Bacteroidota bacterium]
MSYRHSLKLKRPLAFFDLETTGINITADRIIEISILKAMPDGSYTQRTKRLNPTIPIPNEVSLIHGIYDEDIANEPTFKQVARSLEQFLEGCDLAGFNILKFDVPMLVEEFLRADVNFDTSKRLMIDAQRIFHLMEPRSLTAAFKFYTGKEIDSLGGAAHSAEIDTMATFHVLDEQLKRYIDVPVKDVFGTETRPIVNDMDALHNLTFSKIVDLAGRIARNKDGVEIFTFGKHKDKPVLETLAKEPSFYDWMMNGDFPRDTKRHLTEIRLRGFNKK